MAQHPPSRSTIFAALEVNGVMSTDNYAESWKDRSADLLRLTESPHLKSKIVSNTYNEGMLDGHAIAINPADPDGVIFAARMEFVLDPRWRRDVAGHGSRPVLTDDVPAATSKWAQTAKRWARQ